MTAVGRPNKLPMAVGPRMYSAFRAGPRISISHKDVLADGVGVTRESEYGRGQVGARAGKAVRQVAIDRCPVLSCASLVREAWRAQDRPVQRAGVDLVLGLAHVCARSLEDAPGHGFTRVAQEETVTGVVDHRPRDRHQPVGSGLLHPPR